MPNLKLITCTRYLNQVASETSYLATVQTDGYVYFNDNMFFRCLNDLTHPQVWYTTVGSGNSIPQYYTYDATNFRLQELSIGYTLPSKWFKNVCSLTISAVGHNLWMIWCKAPFDPESIATTGNNYQGIDYFMMPSLRSLGFNIKLDF